MKSALEILADALRADSTFTSVEIVDGEVLALINDQPYSVRIEEI